MTEGYDDIIWEDPPAAATEEKRRGQYTAFAAALRERPGIWARLPGEKASADSANGTAQNLRSGRMKDFPRGQFEVAKHERTLWVRFRKPTEEAAGKGQPEQESAGLSQETNSQIRSWARQNGYEVAERGRISTEVVTAWTAATGQSPG